MRDKKFMLKSFLKLTACAVITVLSFGASAQAQIDPQKVTAIYMSTVGVTRGQLTRLNVFYHDLFPPGPCKTDGTCKPPESFNATLTFYSADGSVAVQKTFTLTPDKGAALGFIPTSFDRDGRAAVRAEVTVAPDESGYQPRIIPSVEVMDAATGLTSLLNPGSLSGFNPQPEPPGDFNFGLFNVVKGQTARVNVSYVDMPQGLPPGPCRLVITFIDGDGRTIGQSEQELDPGKTIQFDYSTANFPVGARQRIRASVHVETADGSLVPCLIPSLEIFATDTGKSALFIPGRMMGNE